MMPTFSDYMRLRFILLLGSLAALSPALILHNLADDPLQDAPWWPRGTHSGTFVVFASALIGCIVVYVLMSRNIWRWWSGSISGAFIGALPGIFYWFATPNQDIFWMPFGELFFIGISRGLFLGIAMYYASRDKGQPNSNRLG